MGIEWRRSRGRRIGIHDSGTRGGHQPFDAGHLAVRIRGAIESLSLAGIGGVTASVGVASLGNDYSFEAMFAAADQQIYSAKSAGWNLAHRPFRS